MNDIQAEIVRFDNECAIATSGVTPPGPGPGPGPSNPDYGYILGEILKGIANGNIKITTGTTYSYSGIDSSKIEDGRYYGVSGYSESGTSGTISFSGNSSSASDFGLGTSSTTSGDIIYGDNEEFSAAGFADWLRALFCP